MENTLKDVKVFTKDTFEARVNVITVLHSLS